MASSGLLSPMTKNRRTHKSLLWVLASIGFIFLFTIASSILVNKWQGPDAGSCRSIYMYPSYMRVNGFDETHTRFAKKYSLFLYREQGKDPDFTQHQGIPVLFIPGNAGSYKQVRSVASATTNLYLDKYATVDGKANLDFFAADFNEDLTAFHGRTMLDQAEYLNEAILFILSLYSSQPEKIRPTSVILLAHSMGGIVARTILTLPNYKQDSVNTIITLATPHSAAPATFDADILRIYSEVDNFWRSGFLESEGESSITNEFQELARQRLKDVSLISITGGVTDNTLPADYTQTELLIPNDHSLTVFTSGIPGVYTPIDHLAIVWCDQLRQKLAEVLLLVTDSTTKSCTLALVKRMRVFRQLLLSGFEKESIRDQVAFGLQNRPQDFDILLKLDKDELISTSLRIPGSKVAEKQKKINTLNLRANLPANDVLAFNLLSSGKFDEIINDKLNNVNSFVMGCRNHNNRLPGDSYRTTLALNTTTTGVSQLDCIDLSKDVNEIPRSMFDTTSLEESSIGGDKRPFYVLQYDQELIAAFDYIVIINNGLEKEFVFAELQPYSATKMEMGEASFWNLLTRGYDLSLPSHRPLAVDISIKSAWSSLLAYKVSISGLSIREDSTSPPEQAFAPFIRQYINSPFETKWHMAIHDKQPISVTFHANSPFLHYSHGIGKQSLNLQLWTDSSVSSDESPIDIYLSIDILKSMKLLLLRYRLAILAFPIFICFLVFSLQLRVFRQKRCFISFWEGLSCLCERKSIAPVLILAALLTPLLNSSKTIATFVSLLNPARFNEVLLHQTVRRNDIFLGLQESYLFLLGPVFVLIALALVSSVYLLQVALAQSSVLLYQRLRRMLARKKDKTSPFVNNFGHHHHHRGGRSIGPFQKRRHVIGTIALLFAVSVFIPYQLAYIICFSVQVIVVLKSYTESYLKSQSVAKGIDTPTTTLDSATFEKKFDKTVGTYDNTNKNLVGITNYYLTILNLMIWIIPINAPVVVVFLHNFSLRWSTPFSSHHNVLAILPILIAVEKHVGRKMLNNNNNNNSSSTTTTVHKTLYTVAEMLAIYTAVYALLFGVRNLFFLHHLLNLLLGLLVLIY